MKYKDLVKILKDNGWTVTKENPHDKAKNPAKPGVKIPIPHHKEIDENLAKKILREAGLR